MKSQTEKIQEQGLANTWIKLIADKGLGENTGFKY